MKIEANRKLKPLQLKGASSEINNAGNRGRTLSAQNTSLIMGYGPYEFKVSHLHVNGLITSGENKLARA
jgi:hypothetical protein